MGKKGAPPTLTPKQEEPARVLTLIEVDPAKVDPAVLDAIRKKNSAALTSMFDPLCELSEKDSSNTADTVWYLVTNGNHATGNLNLLMDLVPVCDRWVRPLMGRGLPMQVCARGSVNCNGIKVNDVWYVPGVTANMVSIAHLTDQELTVSIGDGICSIKRPDGTELGKGRRKGHLYELDFINTISATPWYIVSNAAEHMTGNLHLLTNFTPTQPGRPIRTHTGAMLQVRGKGSLTSAQFAIPGINYVPGLAENIISVMQLTDSGFSVAFGPHGCAITRNCGGAKVGAKAGYAFHAGGQLYQLDYLRIAPTVNTIL
ncbi:uncharacterized protein LOC100824446 isoform X1 [Brachypodium distachyon]|uniref:uncharacterized protein LOC100824446 isoform X1 n=1 Tax=Brachypodium distachyon TaxID=15368 RepID=UPI00052FE557|nr:uncharacterized protein LOC100824446 isoform X1 [Brachypodium distachyon]|eukprot:XP_010237150.1 uncharacterized protein LOC100824446 isoform X1 [Brachypodium distachyon]